MLRKFFRQGSSALGQRIHCVVYGNLPVLVVQELYAESLDWFSEHELGLKDFWSGGQSST